MTIDTATQNLIDELRLDFGGKASTKKRGTRTASDKLPETWSELDEAVRIAYLLKNRAIWRPIAVVCHSITQFCDCCGGSATFVGNYFIRHQHARSSTTLDYHIPIQPEHGALPRIFDQVSRTVPECSSCFCTNSFQGHSLGVCSCEMDLGHTCLWKEAMHAIPQLNLFMEDNKDASTNGQTPTPEPSIGGEDQIETGDLGIFKSAFDRPLDNASEIQSSKRTH